MGHRKGDTVIFVEGDTPFRGVITGHKGDMFDITCGGVAGANTRTGKQGVIMPGTRHKVHKSMIMGKVRR